MMAEASGLYRYSNKEADQMLASAARHLQLDPERTEPTLYDNLVTFGGSIIQQARRLLDAQMEDGYEGPTAAELRPIVDDGLEGLGENLRKLLGDWGLYAWNPHLRVTLKSRPSVKLSCPRIDLDGVRIEVLATK